MSVAPFAVFTDLDETLLDKETFDVAEARPVLRRLCAAGIPVVPVTGKTFAEVEPLASELELRHALIVECGGGIARRVRTRWRLEGCSIGSAILLDVLNDLEERTGAKLMVYSTLEPSEASRLTGLSGVALSRSQSRQFDQPFVIVEGDIRALTAAASAMGFSIVQRGRFHCLTGGGGTTSAFERVRRELRCELTIGVGVTQAGAELLALVDLPVIIPCADGAPDAALLKKLPHARIAPAPGPAGWAAAVDSICCEIGLERRSGVA